MYRLVLTSFLSFSRVPDPDAVIRILRFGNGRSVWNKDTVEWYRHSLVYQNFFYFEKHIFLWMSSCPKMVYLPILMFVCDKRIFFWICGHFHWRPIHTGTRAEHRNTTLNTAHIHRPNDFFWTYFIVTESDWAKTTGTCICIICGRVLSHIQKASRKIHSNDDRKNGLWDFRRHKYKHPDTLTIELKYD